MTIKEYKCSACGSTILLQSQYCPVCKEKLDVDKVYENTLFGKLYRFENNEVVRWLYDIIYKKGYGFIKKIISWTKITTPLKAVEKLIKKLFGNLEEHLKNKAKKQNLSEDKLNNKLNRIKLILENEHTIHIVISLICFLVLAIANFGMAQKTVHIKAEPKIINGENYTVKKKWFSNETVIITDDQDIVLRLSLPKYYKNIEIVNNKSDYGVVFNADEPVKLACESKGDYSINLTYTDDSTGTIMFTIE